MSKEEYECCICHKIIESLTLASNIVPELRLPICDGCIINAMSDEE